MDKLESPEIPDDLIAKLSPSDEARILAWLAYIEETDQVLIDGVLDQCRADPEALVYFLKRSTEDSDGEDFEL